MATRTPAVLALLAALLLPACAGTQSVSDIPLEGLTQAGGAGNVPIPNAVAGDAARRGVAQPRATPQTPLTEAQARSLAQTRLTAAASLWDRAEALDTTNPGAAASYYETIFKDYPEYERAAEAKFREGRARIRIRDCDDGAAALKEYMRIAPVNPHLPEVEQLLYEGGSCGLSSKGGLFSFFKSDDASLDALKFVAANFPTGEYADDALMKLGDYYRHDEDYGIAALHYKELLLRYPDSEWSFKARIALADTYLARDQGQPYEAGFIDVDPREMMPAEQAKMVAPVESAVELALEQYEVFLERMDADPARRAEYAQQVAYATRQRDRCREQIAAKDLYRGDWYRSRGCMDGAIEYYREATHWTGTCAARDAQARLDAAQGRPAPVARTAPISPDGPPPRSTAPVSVVPVPPPPAQVPPPPTYTPTQPRSAPSRPMTAPSGRPGVPPPPPPPPFPPSPR